MSKRYETIRFDDFTGGEQCDIIDPPKNSFEMSNDVVIENNKIKLGKNVQGGVLDDLAMDMTDLKKTAISKSSYLYILGVHPVSFDCIIKRIVTYTGVVSIVHTFASGSEAHQFIKFKDKYIISAFIDPAFKIQYSTNFTIWTDCNTIGTGLTITDHKIVDDRLYVLLTNEEIYYSDDGISFTLLVALDSAYEHDDLNYLGGYFYISSFKSDGSNNGLVRISLAGEVQDEIVSIGSVYRFESFVFNGNLYILIDRLFLYCVEGTSLNPVFVFENECRIIFSFGIVDFAFFWDATVNNIIVMNIFEKFSRPYNIVSDVDWTWMIHKDDNNVTIAIHSLSTAVKASIYEDKYISPGSIRTDIIRLKGGLGTPVQLVLNHKPLTANAWVKVYIKFDNAAAWGVAVITSTNLNAVRKVYDFPVGTECSYIQAKIEYGTDDSAETPEDATLDLIYLPTGLVNAE